MPESWPTQFGDVQRGSFAFAESDVGETFGLDSGEIRQRPTRRAQVKKMSVSFELREVRLAMFLAWFHHKINGGQDFFSITILGVSYSVRFSGPIKVTLRQAPFDWVVSTEFEYYA